MNGLLGTINHGNTGGGTNWPGGGLDPETHIFYSQANTAGVTAGSLREPPPEFKTDIKYVSGVKGREFRIADGPGFGSAADAPQRGGGAGGGRGEGSCGDDGGAGRRCCSSGGGRRRARWRRRPGPQGLPLVKPPYGVMAAVNLDKGRNPVACAARRYPRHRAQSSRAQGSDHSEDGSERQRRRARHEDARHRRRIRR